MSLALANIWGWLTLHKRPLLIAAGLLVVLGLVLFAFDRCGTYFAGKDIDKLKSNANAGLANAAKIESEIDVLKGRQAAELEAVKRDTEKLLDAVNATNAAREETNRALQNVNAARNSNTVGITAEQLAEKLRRLE